MRGPLRRGNLFVRTPSLNMAKRNKLVVDTLILKCPSLGLALQIDTPRRFCTSILFFFLLVAILAVDTITCLHMADTAFNMTTSVSPYSSKQA